MDFVYRFFRTIRRHFIRVLINTVFLASSCFFSVNFIIVLFQNALFDWIVAIFAIFVEVYFQYSLYIAERNQKESKSWKGKKHWAALGLKAQYFLLYVCIYAHLSGLGFFLTEVQSTTETLRRLEVVETSNVDRIAQIDKEIEVLNLHLATESETGFGRRSESIVNRKKELETKRETLLKTIGEVSNSDAETVKNSFESLAEKLGLTENFLQLVIFETLLVIIYVGLYVTRWKPGEDDEAGKGAVQETKESSTETSATKKNKTSKKLRNKTSHEKESFAESSGQSSSESSEVMTPKVSVSEKTSLEGLPRITKAPKPQSEWERFIRASIRESGNLNSAKRVSMLTGIPIDRCLEYRKRLDEMRIGGEPVVETTQGVSRAKFEKEEILERVREAI